MMEYTPEAVWQKLGIHVQAMGSRVFVVTDLPATKVGSLYLPVKATTFYGGLPHLVLVRATVLSVGPLVQGVAVGDRVTFPRTYFARWKPIETDVMLGWVDVSQVAGRFTEDDEQEVVGHERTEAAGSRSSDSVG
jgi:hypothetical protein